METQTTAKGTGLNYKDFYKELGRLLYAVAYSDGKVEKKEVEALHEFVLKELASFELESDSSGMNLAFYTQFEFEDIADKKTPAYEAFTTFLDYMRNHASYFNDHFKTAIIKAVKKVAEAYKNTNQEEMDMIKLLTAEIKAL
jgi:hypothetical protein